MFVCYRETIAYEDLYNKVDWTSEVLKVADYSFELPKKDSFYYELRSEVYQYFKKHNMPYNTPTTTYLMLFYFYAVMIIVCTLAQHWYRSILLSIVIGFLYAFAGGYGHQFCHLPNYRVHAHILDWFGLYSHAYLVDHVFLHHIHTNTIADNHFEGTDPFLYVHPYFKRQWYRKSFKFVLANVAVLFGVWGNYLYNIQNILKGKEEFHWCIFLYPMNYALFMIVTDPVTGFLLCTTSTFFVSWYYFNIALMNHNQKENWNLKEIWNARNWAEMELITCTDIGYDYGYIGSMLCLWLNYHAVHHLLPTVDMCHHQDVQKILKRVADKYGVKYHYKPIVGMYFDMIETFSLSRAYELITQL